MQERFINPHTDEESMNAYRDIVNAINTAKKDSFDEGKLQGKLETARRLLTLGIPVSTISDATGLSAEDINQLLSQI